VVKGWVVACRHPHGNGEMLYFFTTLDLKPKCILALYKLRWNIETDLRSLKRTLELHQVTSKSKNMVEKDVTMAVCAYNVVRAVICLSASRAGLRPRQLSFSTAQDAVMAAWPYLQRAKAMAEFHEEMERLLRIVAQAKLPQRSRKRSYPREIWGRGGQFPFRRPGGFSPLARLEAAHLAEIDADERHPRTECLKTDQSRSENLRHRGDLYAGTPMFFP